MTIQLWPLVVYLSLDFISLHFRSSKTLVMLSLQFSLSPSPFSTYSTTTLTPKSKPHSHETRTCFRRPDLPRRRQIYASANDAAVIEGQSDIATEGAEIDGGDKVEKDLLPNGLRRESMPKHVAVIMDGNRRWARARGLPIWSGYEAGFRALRDLVDLCCNWRIEVLTVFAFSSDNWFRPKVEVDFLMKLFERGLRNELVNLSRDDIRISIIGDSSELPKRLQELIAEAQETTKNNSSLHLVVAVNYSGKNDVVQACKNIAVKVRDGLIDPQDINEVLIERELRTNCTDFPYPDLLIRTSGELRISNFFLWQLAYTEFIFVESHWPDFGEVEFLDALRSFQLRQRRYGAQNH